MNRAEWLYYMDQWAHQGPGSMACAFLLALARNSEVSGGGAAILKAAYGHLSRTSTVAEFYDRQGAA